MSYDRIQLPLDLSIIDSFCMQQNNNIAIYCWSIEELLNKIDIETAFWNI